MAGAVACAVRRPSRPGTRLTSFSASKEQALVVLLVQQLAEAQFVRADRAAAERLWQEVAVLQLDVDRVIHLLYCGVDSRDRDALVAEDDLWLANQPRQPWSRWSLGSWRSGWGSGRPRAAVCAS